MKRKLLCYLALYPTLYRAIVLLAVPIVLCGQMCLALYLATIAPNGQSMVWIMAIGVAAAMISVELYGEMLTLGSTCTRKQAYGEMLLSSPKALDFIKNFALVDGLKKVVIYPLIMILPQLIGLATGWCEAFSFRLLGVSAAMICGGMLTMLVLRKTKIIALMGVWLIVMPAATVGMSMPFVITTVPVPVRIVVAAGILIAAGVLFWLGRRDILRGIKEDYYDE